MDVAGISKAEAEKIVEWLEDFMERDEHLYVGTRVKLQQRLEEAFARVLREQEK